ncbi:MAG: tetratricopeptide repeat protein, partial [Desulfovibrionales bacterium]|nr:tetratricopeptide repeat protein [Desulfovibrionales bacterium]
MLRTVLVGVVMLSLSCAASAPPPQPTPNEPSRPAESAEAQAIYAYLAYREYLQQHKTDEAAQAMERAIALAPTPELYLELGNLYWRASRFSDALVVLKQGLDKYPESRLLLSTLAKTYAAQGRFDDAVLTLDDYRKAHPDEIDLVHETAIYRMEQRQFGDAVDRLAAIPKDKATTTTTFLMGKAFFGLGLTDKAIISFQQVVAAEPEYFDAWVELGLTYEAQKNYIDAERIFAQLVDSGVESQQIIFRLVDLNLKLNNPDKALSH